MTVAEAEAADPDPQADPSQAPPATEGASPAELDVEIRYRIQTIIGFLKSGGSLPADCSPAVWHSWEMAARAACEAAERLFRGDR